MSVEEISFAAHVDYTHNSQFIEMIDANHIVTIFSINGLIQILVHGELHQMARLKSALMSKYSSQRDRVKIYNPRNCDELRLYFKGERIAKVYPAYEHFLNFQVVGALANNPPQQDQILNGVLVQKDFNMSLIAAEDLREFAGLDTNVVMQRQTIAFHGGVALLKWHLDQMFGGIIFESGNEGRKPMFKVLPVFETSLRIGYGCSCRGIRINISTLDKLDWECNE
jgi:cleavage and polyadenylation specificity factor subunit 3